jgi:hypothetical protein
MRANTDDIGTFEGTMTVAEGDRWLTTDTGFDGISETVNGAIDEAVSFARDNGFAFVVIKITDATQPAPEAA